MRRALIIAITLLLLTACKGEDMNDKDPDDGASRPTARSQAGGVEVWDLQGAPSAASFGIAQDGVAGVYESDEPRQVRFRLPGGTELTVDAVLVTFEQFGKGNDARFSVGIRTAQLEPAPLVTAYRDVLGQLEVSTDAAARLSAEIKAAPDDQTERISVGSDPVTLGDLKMSAQAGLAPVAGSGRVIIGGSWQD